MATNYKILGQTADASSEQTLYTAPASTNIKLKVTIANRSTAATYRVALVPGGGSTGNSNYVSYDEDIGANVSVTSTTFTLTATDVVRVEASTANVTFTAFGIEQDA